jgi:hypothetical protein
MMLADRQELDAMVSIFKHYGWQRIALLYSQDDLGTMLAGRVSVLPCQLVKGGS